MTTDTDTTCVAPGCRNRPAPRLCPGHTAKVGQWLADLEQLYATLDPRLSMATDWNSAGGHALASHRSPARLDVLVLRDARSRERSDDDPDGNRSRSVLEVLHAYAQTIRADRDLTPEPRPSVYTERALLAAHLDWLLDTDDVADFYRELREVWSQLRAAHGHRRPKPAASCWVPKEDDTGLCGGPVWAGRGSAWCSQCGTSWAGAEFVRISLVFGKESA